jgi:hypothetical protein
MSDEILIEDAMLECDRSFHNNDLTGYNRILLKLAEVKNKTGAIDKAIRMAEAGLTLSSARFAYPHIKDFLSDAVDE